MVYARARRSDLARATHIEFDLTPDGLDGFVECRVKNPKQARAANKRNLFLPLTALFGGLSEVPWGATFLAVRQANGLETCGALDHPLLPGLTVAGAWLQECVSSSQLTQWLRCILSKAPDADIASIALLRSHSCKATLLSWASKAGLSDRTLTLLGYHSQGVNLSSVGYRRDAPALSENFYKSGRWQEPGSPASSTSVVTSPPNSAEGLSSAPATEVEVETSSSSESSEASRDSDDDAEQLVAAAPHFLENILAFGGHAIAGNKKNNLLHIVRVKTGRLLCGRLLSESFSVTSEVDAGSGRFCRTCKTCALTASVLTAPIVPYQISCLSQQKLSNHVSFIGQGRCYPTNSPRPKLQAAEWLRSVNRSCANLEAMLSTKLDQHSQVRLANSVRGGSCTARLDGSWAEQSAKLPAVLPKASDNSSRVQVQAIEAADTGEDGINLLTCVLNLRRRFVRTAANSEGFIGEPFMSASLACQEPDTLEPPTRSIPPNCRTEDYLRDLRHIVRLVSPGLPAAARLLEGVVKGVVMAFDAELHAVHLELHTRKANLGSLDEARAEIEQLRSDLEGLDSRHSTSNESTREKQRTELATLQQQNSDLKKQLNMADGVKQAEIRTYQEKVDKLKDELGRLHPDDGSVEGVAHIMDRCLVLSIELLECICV
eukprot:s7755_g2.t1